jgi:hypothetical protein
MFRFWSSCASGVGMVRLIHFLGEDLRSQETKCCETVVLIGISFVVASATYGMSLGRNMSTPITTGAMATIIRRPRRI